MKKAIFKKAVPYKDDALNLPVANVDDAIPFYETTFDFRVVSKSDEPHKRAILARDEIQIGLTENGGDPTQEGCYFEVDDVDAAFEEIKESGTQVSEPKVQQQGESTLKAFFVIAPDGLCYMLGQPQES
ncbi:MAG TPA: VOC family protein [Pyrinomonadaceae bacterium]|nr:VOC family protein [Pyrinomonadaceae bacterium]